MKSFDSARVLALRPFILIATLALSFLSVSGADLLYSVTTNQIKVIDANTGTQLNSFTPPSPPQTAGGNGLAFSGSALYYTTISTSSIYVLNPVNGAVFTSFLGPLTGIDALGYGTSAFGNTLFALDYTANRLHWLSPATGVSFKSVILSFDAVGGIDFNTARGTLYASDTIGTIRELNPDTASVLNSFSTGAFQIGLGFVGNRLFTSSQSGNLIEERDPVTGLVLGSFISPGGPAGALAGSPVPEPSTITLLALAFATLFPCLKRKGFQAENPSPS